MVPSLWCRWIRITSASLRSLRGSMTPLFSYAEAVRAYRHPVIMSFGHEMNGYWYSWGYRKTSPAVFVAAWRHIVKIFRVLGAQNVTWLWTVNIINDTHGGQIPRPGQWWPGSSYVNWVGIDGYYLKPSWKFAPLFGPTIAAVRSVTADPILIAETGAVPAADQPERYMIFSMVSVSMGCSASYGSIQRTLNIRISVSAAQRPLLPSARAQTAIQGLDRELRLPDCPAYIDG